MVSSTTTACETPEADLQSPGHEKSFTPPNSPPAGGSADLINLIPTVAPQDTADEQSFTPPNTPPATKFTLAITSTPEEQEQSYTPPNSPPACQPTYTSKSAPPVHVQSENDTCFEDELQYPSPDSSSDLDYIVGLDSRAGQPRDAGVVSYTPPGSPPGKNHNVADFSALPQNIILCSEVSDYPSEGTKGKQPKLGNSVPSKKHSCHIQNGDDAPSASLHPSDASTEVTGYVETETSENDDGSETEFRPLLALKRAKGDPTDTEKRRRINRWAKNVAESGSGDGAEAESHSSERTMQNGGMSDRDGIDANAMTQEASVEITAFIPCPSPSISAEI